MSSITYSLKGGQATSNNYYEKAERLSKKVILDVFQNGKEYLQDFMEYIGKNKVEALRTKEEYGVELLFIGVILMEYSEYAYGFNPKWSGFFKWLNSLRNKERIKENINVYDFTISDEDMYKINNINIKEWSGLDPDNLRY